MKSLTLVFAGLCFATGAVFILWCRPPLSWIAGTLFALLAFGIVFATSRKTRKILVRLKGFTWTREDFCRGWLITGDTGSGKTRSGINQLLFQVFQNDPHWGGLCIDDKGVYWEVLSEMAAHFKRTDDLILLQVRPDDAPAGWKPRHTFNLTSDRAIPFSTYAKFVIDTASSLGQSGDKGFFKSQAQTHIAVALEVLHELDTDVDLENVHRLLLGEDDIKAAIEDLVELFATERRQTLLKHLRQRYQNQPPEQLGGVKETIANYLQYFLTPDVAEIFSAADNTFQLADMDRGKIICLVMPQKFQTERRYINTFLKMLFYTHVLRRFDKPKDKRKDDNLLVLWADEAQRFVTAAEDGMSDFNTVDVIREAGAAIVAAAQSTTSFIPPLGPDKTKVLTLNLRNRMVFKAADEQGAVDSADFLGHRKVIKRSWGYQGNQRNRNYHEEEEHRIKPYKLRGLKKHTCVLGHCDGRIKKVLLPPLEPDGTVSDWFRR